jgi:hypothetical protein
MFAIWANFHGGFIVGLAALGVAALVLSAQDLRAGRGITRPVRSATVASGCAAATLLNPAGTRLWHDVFHSVSDPVIRPYVYDWMPAAQFFGRLWHGPNVQVVQFALPLLLLGVFVVALFAAPMLCDAPLIVIALVFSVAAFYAQRNVPLAIIALAIPLSHHAGIALDQNFSSLRALSGATPF